jgi:hypothetical protein
MGQHLSQEEYIESEEKRVNFIIDMVFTGVFFTYLCIHSYFSWKTLLIRDNWNVYNIISSYCIFACLTVQIIMMLWVSFHDNNTDYQKANIE